MLDANFKQIGQIVTSANLEYFYLTAHPETEALVLSGDSSDHSHCADAERFTKLYGLLFNLLRQLTSWGQNHSIRTLV